MFDSQTSLVALHTLNYHTYILLHTLRQRTQLRGEYSIWIHERQSNNRMDKPAQSGLFDRYY